MNDFLTTALTFPTLLYSIVLAVCVVYWLLAATGLVDADGPDGLIGGESHGHGHDGDASSIAAMIARLGLSGVPVMIVLTVLAFLGWLGTYFVHLLVLRSLPDAFRLLAGIGVAIAMLVPGVFATSLLLRPLSRLLLRLRPPTEASILGRVAIVSTPSVDAGYGQATVDDGGAGLVLQIRDAQAERFKRGDRVVLIEYLGAQHAYRVVSDEQFQRL
ncbi:hypothetical protein [Lysobacter auxotrophicus]|uniref:DUF1449 family protein n=1 Tax=Lysobacter auxotrophicus TaxID=2992573 RepID=A0ABN6UGD9_9GAMM|nr:hypothetical protein [Lysobacter auxotrophicus]BDU15177.1 DUF1449 family protein [Lysobacter auxotrophicus]